MSRKIETQRKEQKDMDVKNAVNTLDVLFERPDIVYRNFQN